MRQPACETSALADSVGPTGCTEQISYATLLMEVLMAPPILLCLPKDVKPMASRNGRQEQLCPSAGLGMAIETHQSAAGIVGPTLALVSTISAHQPSSASACMPSFRLS